LLDCAFAPALALWVSRAVLAARSRHNYGFVVLLATVCTGNVLMHAAVTGWLGQALFVGERLSLYAVLAMLVVIAGRIVPGFTESVLRRKGIVAQPRAPRWVERAVLLAFALAVLADLLRLPAAVRTVMWLLLAVGLLARMLRWRTGSVLHEPILWILHAGQLWLVGGSALLALAAWSSGWPELSAQHALSAGAVGTTVLGVMTRAALGHSGRALSTGPAIITAYLFVIAGGLLRVLAPAWPMHYYVPLVSAAGAAWLLGYAIFAVVYWPILTGPEVDEAAARGKRVLRTV
ncbi:MAG TPA: NnrS family protein, partial [Polyangiales bacterium]